MALSPGSEISACLVTAESSESPMERNAATTAPVPTPGGAAEDEGGDRGGDHADQHAGGKAGNRGQVGAAQRAEAGGGAGQEADKCGTGGEGQHGRVEQRPDERAEHAGGGAGPASGQEADQHGAQRVQVERDHHGADELAQHDVQRQRHGDQGERGDRQLGQHRRQQQDRGDQVGGEGRQGHGRPEAVGEAGRLGQHQGGVGAGEQQRSGCGQQAAAQRAPGGGLGQGQVR